MKNVKLICVLAIAVFINTQVAFSQQWSGANNTSGDISRTGKVTIGPYGSADYLLNVNTLTEDAIHIESHKSGGKAIHSIGYNGAYAGYFVGKTHISQSLGIGVTNPARNLHIKALSDKNIRLEEDGSGTEYFELGVDNAGDLNIYRDNGSMALSILDKNGNVGIGTSSPNSLLHVNAATGNAFRVQLNGSTKLLVGSNGGASVGTYLGAPANGLYVSGNASIGSSNPSSKLEVNGDIALSLNTHRRGKLRLYKESDTTDDFVSHGIGTEHYHNTYGPGSSYDASIGHKFYTYRNEVAAQIGFGGAGSPTNRLNSTFYGSMSIGTPNHPIGYRLAVDGNIICEEVRVQLSHNWPDYVFADDYSLISLEDLEKSIQENKHLPGIPSAKEVEANGISVGEMQTMMMEKIEELTLYVIELNKENKLLKERINSLEK